MREQVTFMQLLKDSYILRFSLILILTITVCVMYATGQPVPMDLYTIWIACLGYGLGILNEKALNTMPPTVVSMEVKK